MKYLISLAILLGPAVSAATAQEPIPANRLTPYMLAEIERDYPAPAVECLKESLPKALAAKKMYIFTRDYQLGQLWLLSLASLEDPTIPIYICTPDGLAEGLEMFQALMAARMGLPF